MRDVCCPFAAHRPGVLPEIGPEGAVWDVEPPPFGPVSRTAGWTTFGDHVGRTWAARATGETTMQITPPTIAKAVVEAGTVAALIWGVACGGSARAVTAPPTQTATSTATATGTATATAPPPATSTPVPPPALGFSRHADGTCWSTTRTSTGAVRTDAVGCPRAEDLAPPNPTALARGATAVAAWAGEATRVAVNIAVGRTVCASDNATVRAGAGCQP
jgi:hypothetical protein